jgi:hypothetical protein
VNSTWFEHAARMIRIYFSMSYVSFSFHYKRENKIFEQVLLLNWSQTRYRCATRSLADNISIVFTSFLLFSSFNFFRKKEIWPRRDLNTQPSDLESDALPLRHGVDVSRGMEKKVVVLICKENSTNANIQ